MEEENILAHEINLIFERYGENRHNKSDRNEWLPKIY